MEDKLLNDRKLDSLMLWIIVYILFLVLGIMILGMINGTIDFNFSSLLIEALSQFGGALSGAALAGYFSLKLFEKNLDSERFKGEQEQNFKKIIYLNDYLRLSWDIEDILRSLNYDFMEIVQRTGDDDYEFERYSIILKLYQNKSKEITSNIKILEEKLELHSHNEIQDYQFIFNVKEHQHLLKKIKEGLTHITGLQNIEDFKGLWRIQDCVSYTQKYLTGLDRLGQNLHGLR